MMHIHYPDHIAEERRSVISVLSVDGVLMLLSLFPHAVCEQRGAGGGIKQAQLLSSSSTLTVRFVPCPRSHLKGSYEREIFLVLPEVLKAFA